MKASLTFLLVLFPAFAQETVAPTTGESTLSPRGENKGDYNVVQSWEFGYRFASVGGDDGKYRSDVNFGDGVRLLSSYLTVNSRDGHGRLFDEITLTTQGLGNDPYESARFSIRKNRWYQYDLFWRSNDYFNPGLVVADGEHLEDTTYRWQDHDLTILPESKLRFRAGYSRTIQSGPALTTAQEFNTTGDVFPIFRDTREQYNEYRLGADLILRSFHFSVLHRWEYFKDDTTDNLAFTEQGAPTDPSLLSGFNRAQPYRGRTQAWLVNLYGEQKWIAVNGRFTYAGGRGDFVQNEIATGINSLSNPQNIQTVVTGTGDRPVISGNLNITLFPNNRLSVTTDTAVSDTRMVGNDAFEQFNNATASAQTVNFQFLGLLLITNSTDVRYRFSKKFSVFAGYRYSDRRIDSTEDQANAGAAFRGLTATQSAQITAGVIGFNWMPLAGLNVHAESEIGRNNNPFAPISLRDYHTLQSRIQYRKKSYTLGGGYQESYNNNSIVITAYGSHSRTYTGSASWAARSWLALDASYSKLHLDTAGGLAFFAGTPTAVLTTAQSLYISNIHAGNLGLRFALGNRADLYLGYNITKDTGDGRSTATSTGTPATQLLASVQTFPLTYQTPLVRLSMKITEKLRYNIGYQYYDYHEELGLLSTNQSYRAHTGYTSLLWSF